MALQFIERGDLVEPSPKVSTWPVSNKAVPLTNNGMGTKIKPLTKPTK